MPIAKEKNRGYYKIKGAARAFNFDFSNKIVLDIGSSTGGFTEYALEKGAKKVIAIEKGTNQMLSHLRNDPRVELHEKTDIFNVTLVPDIIMIDVSFTSLKEILLYAKEKLADSHTEFLAMLKPQFEAKESQLIKGIVKNEKIRREIIKDFEVWLKKHKYLVIGKHDNEITGKNGNRERFYYLNLAK